MKHWYLLKIRKNGEVIACEKFYYTKKELDNFVCKIFKCFPKCGRIEVKQLS